MFIWISSKCTVLATPFHPNIGTLLLTGWSSTRCEFYSIYTTREVSYKFFVVSSCCLSVHHIIDTHYHPISTIKNHQQTTHFLSVQVLFELRAFLIQRRTSRVITLSFALNAHSATPAIAYALSFHASLPSPCVIPPAPRMRSQFLEEEPLLASWKGVTVYLIWRALHVQEQGPSTTHAAGTTRLTNNSSTCWDEMRFGVGLRVETSTWHGEPESNCFGRHIVRRVGARLEEEGSSVS